MRSFAAAGDSAANPDDGRRARCGSALRYFPEKMSQTAAYAGQHAPPPCRLSRAGLRGAAGEGAAGMTAATGFTCGFEAAIVVVMGDKADALAAEARAAI